MLTRARTCAAGGVALLALTALLAGAPAAVADSHFPASAKNRLAKEMRQAWRITRGRGVTIALLTTEVDAVSGLSGKLTTGPDYAPVAGASALDGTLLASLIAGSGQAGTSPFGSIGRAPGARILAERIVDYGSRRSVKLYQQDGTWQAIVAKAIRYAVNHGAGVIVAEEADSSDSAVLESAISYAISHNVVVIGEAEDLPGKPTPLAYPDSSPGVINFSGQLLTGLQKPSKPPRAPANSSVLLTAPDNVLPATGPGNQPYIAWGFYSEIAWVAGTVALIKSAYPHITPAQVARALAESASYHPKHGYNITVGFGLLNPAGALHDAARLLHLGMTAAPGPDVVSTHTRFGVPSVTVIRAVKHSTARLAGYGAAIVAGLIMLGAGLLLGIRQRRAFRLPA
jgi:hypothetical protein